MKKTKARMGVPARALWTVTSLVSADGEAKQQEANQYSFLGSCMLRTRL
jgi:hypothetical protein